MSSGNTSGAWETVGKPSKKSKGPVNNGKKAKNGGVVSVGPRIEDVLPLKQVNSWYANAYDTPPSDSDEEKKKVEQPSSKPSAPTKPNKKPSKSTTSAATSSKKPSKITDAASLVHASELKAFLADVSTGYPNHKELWVREIAIYLNACLETTEKQPEFLSDPFTDLPASALFKEAKKIITSTLEECSGSERQNCFDTMLANVAHFMVKGKPVNGFLTVIQVLLEAFPNICHGNIPKFSELRNSYQNQPHICLTLLWAVGQGGKQDLKAGLKAWIELMMPLISLRHYHKFIVSYLSTLLEKHSISAASSKSPRRLIIPAQFMQFLQVFYVHGPASLNKELTKSLSESYPAIQALALGDGSMCYELFPLLMRRLAAPDSQTNDKERSEILRLLQECIALSAEASICQWTLMYTSFVPQSALLLEHLAQHWSDLSVNVQRSCELSRALEVFSDFNSSKKGQDGTRESNSFCAILKDRSEMARKESKGWFPWKTSCFLLLLVISALVRYDASRSSTLRASNMGTLLSDVGLYDPFSSAVLSSRASMASGLQWMEDTSPAGMKMVRDAAHVAGEAAGEGAQMMQEAANKGFRASSEYAETHLPGIKAQAQYYGEELISSGRVLSQWTADNAPHAKNWVKFQVEKLLTFLFNSFESLKEKIEVSGIKDIVVKKVSEGYQISVQGLNYAMEQAYKYIQSDK